MPMGAELKPAEEDSWEDQVESMERSAFAARHKIMMIGICQDGPERKYSGT